MRRVGVAVLGAGVLTAVLVALKSQLPVRAGGVDGSSAVGVGSGSASGAGGAAGSFGAGGSSWSGGPSTSGGSVVPGASAAAGRSTASGGSVGSAASGGAAPGATKPPGVSGTPGVGVVDMHRMMDGAHLGAVVTNPFGPVQVRIEVRGGRLVDVVPVRLPTAAARGIEIGMRAAPVLREQALRRQSADLDTVSGATYTSDGYRRSLQSALDAARTGRPAA